MLNRVIARLLDREQDPLGGPKLLASTASGMMEDVAYQQARENIVTRIVSQWIATTPDQTSKREQLYLQICALGDLQSELALMVHNNEEKEQDNAR